jgi:PPK2 family polyphosphate:nucleotide phosphotransferase
MADLGGRWRVEPGSKVRLDQIDTRSEAGAPGDKKATTDTFPEQQERLADLQARLWAEDRQALLVVIQAIDGGGKDSTIRHVFTGLNPQGTKVTSFKVPSDEELDHDFLWRVHKATPGKGEIMVFNRSHYEDVLVVRVHGLVPESVWRPRYEHIRAFEENLVAAGTRVVKFFLHISKEEQADRFQERIDDPAKRWKFRLADLDERRRWDDYQAAFAEAIERTSTEAAPWYVIPADRNWYRNWAVSTVLIETLEAVDPRYPESEEDLSGVVVE